MGILSTYRDFKNFEPNYYKWYDEQLLKDRKTKFVLDKKPVTQESLREQERAKILVNALTSLDEYAQTKAEDVDSTSQTLLYVAVGALGAVGTYLGEKFSRTIKNPKMSKLVASTMGIGFALATFIPIVKSTVENQVRANRMARFEGINDKLFHINNFAVLSKEQKQQAKQMADRIPDNSINLDNSIINRANIFNSISVYKDLTLKQGEYSYLKQHYDKQLKDDRLKTMQVSFSNAEIKQSQRDKKIFNQLLKKIDIESQYPLERVERLVNVSYSAMFMGGVLEYLVSDGVLNLLKIKNKVVRPVLSWGLPVLTVMSLNKQIANFLNDAVKSVRYKKMQEFVNDNNNFKEYDEKEIKDVKTTDKEQPKPKFMDFLRQTLKDMKDYEEYQNTRRINEKKYDIAVRNVELTEEQKNDAQLLKRNTQLMINSLDDQMQKYVTSMETITESTTIPVDILAPLLGTFAAGKIHKAVAPSGKFGTLFKGLGMLLAFIPAAASEIYFVGQQRSAKRCAALIASNSLQDANKFLDPKNKEITIKDPIQRWTFNAKKIFEKS